MYRKTKTHSTLILPQSTCYPHCPATVVTSCDPPAVRHTPTGMAAIYCGLVPPRHTVHAHPRYAMYPRRLGAWRGKAGRRATERPYPLWTGSSDHTTSLAPSRFSATRRGGAGTSRTYTTQPRSLTGSSRARRPRGPCRAGSRPYRRSSWHTAAASRHPRS